MCSIERKLKTFIENKRLKKRQEIETSINRQRQKCEEEIRRNRMKMSLDEVWQELSKLEKRLLDLKQTKHQLFSQLKKVLNEDEQRRRHRETLWHSQQIHFQPDPQLHSQSQPGQLQHPFLPMSTNQITQMNPMSSLPSLPVSHFQFQNQNQNSIRFPINNNKTFQNISHIKTNPNPSAPPLPPPIQSQRQPQATKRAHQETSGGSPTAFKQSTNTSGQTTYTPSMNNFGQLLNPYHGGAPPGQQQQSQQFRHKYY